MTPSEDYLAQACGLIDTVERQLDAVRIADNVICGADEKVLYAADWSALAPPGEARAGAVQHRRERSCDQIGHLRLDSYVRPGGSYRFGEFGSTAHVFELFAAQLFSQPLELVALLVLGVIEDGVAEFSQLVCELRAVDVEFLQLLQHLLCFELLA